jgi:hypothetical protein
MRVRVLFLTLKSIEKWKDELHKIVCQWIGAQFPLAREIKIRLKKGYNIEGALAENLRVLQGE